MRCSMRKGVIRKEQTKFSYLLFFMSMKFVVLNDRNIPMNLQIQSWGKEDKYQIIQPQECKIVELDVGDSAVPYLKIWETGQALLSYYPLDSLPSL